MRPGTSRRARFLVAFGFVALLLAGFAMSSPAAFAQKVKTHEGRGADFAEGCGNAGGNAQTLESKDKSATHVRCNFGDYAVSCVFKDGVTPESNVNVCVDSRGITSQPPVSDRDFGLLATRAETRGTPSRSSGGSR